MKPNSKGDDMPYLTSDAFFGGILIRGIDKIDKSSGDIIKRIDVPFKLVYELFDQFNALSKPNNFPCLVAYQQIGRAHV